MDIGQRLISFSGSVWGVYTLSTESCFRCFNVTLKMEQRNISFLNTAMFRTYWKKNTVALIKFKPIYLTRQCFNLRVGLEISLDTLKTLDKAHAPVIVLKMVSEQPQKWLHPEEVAVAHSPGAAGLGAELCQEGFAAVPAALFQREQCLRQSSIFWCALRLSCVSLPKSQLMEREDGETIGHTNKFLKSFG